jgi:hypothetical protein
MEPSMRSPRSTGVVPNEATRTGWIAPCLVGCAVAMVFFAPVALYLQWALPGDGPYEYFVTALSLPLVVLAAVLTLMRRLRTTSGRFTIATLLGFFTVLQVWVYTPQLSRKVGQWTDLRAMLLDKSSEIESARNEMGLPVDRPLSRNEVELLEERLFTPRPGFEFYFPSKAVTLRILSAEPPYVGVDYGEGRNCTFDLDSMVATYCD